jgi:hypothetical protein
MAGKRVPYLKANTAVVGAHPVGDIFRVNAQALARITTDQGETPQDL